MSTEEDPWDRPLGKFSLWRWPRWLQVLWLVVIAGIILRLAVGSIQWLLS